MFCSLCRASGIAFSVISNQSDFSITGIQHVIPTVGKIFPNCLRKAGTRFRSSRSNIQKAVGGLVARGAKATYGFFCS